MTVKCQSVSCFPVVVGLLVVGRHSQWLYTNALQQARLIYSKCSICVVYIVGMVSVM